MGALPCPLAPHARGARFLSAGSSRTLEAITCARPPTTTSTRPICSAESECLGNGNRVFRRPLIRVLLRCLQLFADEGTRVPGAQARLHRVQVPLLLQRRHVLLLRHHALLPGSRRSMCPLLGLTSDEYALSARGVGLPPEQPGAQRDAQESAGAVPEPAQRVRAADHGRAVAPVDTQPGCAACRASV